MDQRCIKIRLVVVVVGVEGEVAGCLVQERAGAEEAGMTEVEEVREVDAAEDEVVRTLEEHPGIRGKMEEWGLEEAALGEEAGAEEVQRVIEARKALKDLTQVFAMIPYDSRAPILVLAAAKNMEAMTTCLTVVVWVVVQAWVEAAAEVVDAQVCLTVITLNLDREGCSQEEEMTIVALVERMQEEWVCLAVEDLVFLVGQPPHTMMNFKLTGEALVVEVEVTEAVAEATVVLGYMRKLGIMGATLTVMRELLMVLVVEGNPTIVRVTGKVVSAAVVEVLVEVVNNTRTTPLTHLLAVEEERDHSIPVSSLWAAAGGTPNNNISRLLMKSAIHPRLIVVAREVLDEEELVVPEVAEDGASE